MGIELGIKNSTFTTVPGLRDDILNNGSPSTAMLEQQQSDQPPFSTEANVAFSDPDSTDTYLVLREKGLNPLRSEIVAICEYIPLVNGELSENAAEIQYELGDNQKIGVTNVARLIELHRQIREYISETAILVLKKMYPGLAKESYLTALKSSVKQLYTSNIDLKLEKTINNILDYYKSTNFLSGQNEFVAITQQYNTNPFFEALVEFYIYESMIDSLVGYIGTVQQMDLAAKIAFPITNFSLLKEFSPQGTFSTNKIAELFSTVPTTMLHETPANLQKELLGIVRTDLNSDTDMFINTLSHLVSVIYCKDSIKVLDSLESADDTSLTIAPNEVRMGIKGDLGASIKELKSVSTSGCILYLGEGTTPERTTSASDGGIGGSYNSSEKLSDTKYNDIFSHVVDSNDADSSPERGMHELMAVMAYDVISANIDFVGTMTGILENMRLKPGDLEEMQSKMASSVQQQHEDEARVFYKNYITAFLETMTGFPRERMTSNNVERIVREDIPDWNSEGIINYGRFTRSVLGTKTALDPVDELTVGYFPLESTNNEKPSRLSNLPENTPVYNATDFYIQRAIDSAEIEEHGSEPSTLKLDFTNFNADVDNYKQLADDFAYNLFTLLPDHKMANSTAENGDECTALGNGDTKDYLRFLFRELEEDLEGILLDGTNRPASQIPLLATFLRDCSDKHQIKNFCAMFWGIVDAGHEYFVGKSGSFEDIDQNEVDFEIPDEEDVPKLNTGSQSTGIRNIIAPWIEFWNENAVRHLLEDVLNLSIQEDSKDKRNNFKGGSGEKYPVYMGDHGHQFFDEDSQVQGRIDEPINVNSEAPSELHGLISTNPETMTMSCRGWFADCDNAFDESFGGGTGDSLEEILDMANSTNNFLTGLLAGSGMTGTILGVVGLIVGFSLIACGIFYPPVAAVGTKIAIRSAVILFISLGLGGAAVANGWQTAHVYGMGRLLKRSMGHVMMGNYQTIGIRLDEDNVMNAGHDMFQGSIFREGKIRPHPGVIGHIAGFSTQHRAIIWYRWVHTLLRQSLGVTAQVKDTDLFLTMETRGMKSVIDALRYYQNKDSKYGSDVMSIDDGGAYQNAKNYIGELLNIVDSRQQKIRDIIAMIPAHSVSLKQTQERVQAAIQRTESAKSKLAIGTLMSENLFKDVMTLANDHTPGNIYQSSQNLLYTSPGSLFSRNFKYSLTKNKLMTRVLSEPGYGLLKSESRGNKSVINVGIPNGMLKTLRENAVDKTGNLDFYRSPYVCISVYKKDHMNPELELYPKNFVFDTSANILDFHAGTDIQSNHISSFTEDSSFESILKSIDIQRFLSDQTGVIKKKTTRGYPEGIYSREVLINHVQSHFLKEYFKATTGLNFEEETFLLTKQQSISHDSVAPGSIVGSRLLEEYQKMMELLTKLYPGAENDPRFESEVFRLAALLRQSSPFSARNRLRTVMIPNTFDKIYSILVNEKDFVPDDRSAISSTENMVRIGLTNNQIFETPVNYSLGGKFQRPAGLKPGMENFSGNPGLDVYEKYIDTLENNYPEVYNYYVTVSLLPVGFLAGANLMFTDEDVLETQAAESNHKALDTHKLWVGGDASDAAKSHIDLLL